MADWTLTRAAGAATYTATLTADASNNTKGAWVELAASAGAAGFYLYVTNASNSGLSFLIDIGTGASMSEAAVLENFMYSQGGSPARQTAVWVYIPLRIAAASRIVARCQCSTGASTIQVALYLVTSNSGLPVYGRATTYGADTSDSAGTQVDPGGTADTKNTTWAALSASTTNDIAYAVCCFGNQLNIAETDGSFRWDLGSGGAGSEVASLANLPLHAAASHDGKFPGAYGFPVEISAGSRLAATAQCSHNNATDRLFDLVVIGFDQQESVGGGAGGGIRLAGRGGLAA